MTCRSLALLTRSLYLQQAIVQVHIRWYCLQGPAQVCDVVDVAVHVHVTAASYLNGTLDLHSAGSMSCSFKVNTEILQSYRSDFALKPAHHGA